MFINFRGPRDFINGGGLLIQGGDCIYIYIYIYTQTRTRTHAHTHTHTHTHAQTADNKHNKRYEHAQACRHANTQTCKHKMYTHARAHKHTHTQSRQHNKNKMLHRSTLPGAHPLHVRCDAETSPPGLHRYAPHLFIIS